MESAAGQIGALEAALLGVVQGLTEYLPISSSGHLTLAQHLLGFTEPEIFFDIVLHLGTLTAVCWFYRADLVTAIKETISGIGQMKEGSAISEVMGRLEGFRLSALVFMAMIPTGIIGLSMKKWFEAMFEAPALVGLMLVITGAFLFLTRYARQKGSGLMDFTVAMALIVGAAQGLAVAPGVSRSGATICAALFLGAERQTAAKFSFILSIPAVLCALILKLRDGLGSVPFPSLAVGFIVSLIVGYLCLALLLFIIKRGKFSWFSYYCLAVGSAAIYKFA